MTARSHTVRNGAGQVGQSGSGISCGPSRHHRQGSCQIWQKPAPEIWRVHILRRDYRMQHRPGLASALKNRIGPSGRDMRIPRDVQTCLYTF